MIGSQPNLSPGQSAWKKNPIADLSGIARPRKIADVDTMSVGNNAQADKLREGAMAYRDTQHSRDGQGFSQVGPNAMFAAQQLGQASSEGAQARAGIEAEDQMFNAGQDAAYQGRVLGRLNSNRGQAMAANDSNFNFGMAKNQGLWDVAKNRQQNWNQIRLSMMSNLS